MKCEAILFDMDGVIIDSEPLYWAYMRKVLQTIGKDMSEDIFKTQVGIAARESAPQVVKALNLGMSPEEYIHFMDFAPMFQDVIDGKSTLNLIEGFLDLAQAFNKKLPYAVATGSPPLFREAVRSKFSLDEYFSAYISACDVPQGKPAPDIYLEAAKRLGVPVNRCIVIDDAPAGVQAGRAAGAYVIAAPNKWTAHFNFEPADVVCSSLNKVRLHIEELLQEGN